jgi:hypothetical protein
MRIEHLLLVCTVAFIAVGCSDEESTPSAFVDAWTWDGPGHKTRTSPNHERRAGAGIVEDGMIRLDIGEAGTDHPVDMGISYTEFLPTPKKGKWDMRWLSDSELVFEHPELGTKTWYVEGAGATDLVVNVKTDWQLPAKH